MDIEAQSELARTETQLSITIDAIKRDTVFQKHYNLVKLKIENALLEWQRDQCKEHRGDHSEIGKRVEMSEQMFKLLNDLYDGQFIENQVRDKNRPRLNNQHG